MGLLGLNNNVSERIGLRALAAHQREIGISLERLSTGKKINRASDDAAGLIGSERLKADQSAILAKIQANAQGEARYGAIDGGLSAVQDLVSELHANLVQAANTGGLSDDERAALQVSTNGIIDGIEHLAGFQYNGEAILQPYIGASASATVQLQAGQPATTSNLAGALDALRSGGTLNLVNGYLDGADKFVSDLESSIVGSRAAAGAVQNGLESETRALMTQNENLSSAISQIVDTDYASEVGSLVRSQALAEAAQFSVLAARDMQAKTVLALIKGGAIGLSGNASSDDKKRSSL